ncbi:uncharacterized protein LOC110726697 [Chenopodium quinoa]|nr:uncharacterized protein LOC110722338 [Chenopodium quinoa]XP_021761861.1 uncharacterized protein LOC110726697 [Chenopodium quinoa]
MKDSSVFPGFESCNTANNGRSSSDYDAKADFKEILEEAKKYAKEKKHKQAKEEKRGKNQASSSGVKKGGKKSWKSAFLSFWKSSSSKKAKKQAKETPKNRGNVSGPIHGGAGVTATAVGAGYWPRLAFSGPLTNMFHQRKREDDIPYVNLERLNEPEYDAKTYGPVYSAP